MHVIYCSISVHGTHRFIQFALLLMLASLLNAPNDNVHSPIFASFYFHTGSEFSWNTWIRCRHFLLQSAENFQITRIGESHLFAISALAFALWSACSSKWWKINFDDDFSCGGITNALHSINFRTEKELKWKKLLSAGIWMLVKNVGHIFSLSAKRNDQMRLVYSLILFSRLDSFTSLRHIISCAVRTLHVLRRMLFISGMPDKTTENWILIDIYYPRWEKYNARPKRVKVNGLLIIFDIWWSLKIIMKGCCLNTSCTWILPYQRSATRKFRDFFLIQSCFAYASHFPFQLFSFSSRIEHFFGVDRCRTGSLMPSDDYFYSQFLRQIKKLIYRRRCIASLSKQNFDALLMRILGRFYPAMSLFLQFSTTLIMAALHVSHFHHEIYK